MLGVDIDYYVEVNMAGLTRSSTRSAGSPSTSGRHRCPSAACSPTAGTSAQRLRPAGVQHLDGEQALWFARSRRDSDDYSRMGRQRCLLQSMLQQKSPTDVITHFQDIADGHHEQRRDQHPAGGARRARRAGGRQAAHAAEHLVRPQPARPQPARRTVQHQPRRRLLHARSRAERVRRARPRPPADAHPGAPADLVPTRDHRHPTGPPPPHPRRLALDGSCHDHRFGAKTGQIRPETHPTGDHGGAWASRGWGVTGVGRHRGGASQGWGVTHRGWRDTPAADDRCRRSAARARPVRRRPGAPGTGAR